MPQKHQTINTSPPYNSSPNSCHLPITKSNHCIANYNKIAYNFKRKHSNSSNSCLSQNRLTKASQIFLVVSSRNDTIIGGRLRLNHKNHYVFILFAGADSAANSSQKMENCCLSLLFSPKRISCADWTGFISSRILVRVL